MAGIAIVVMGMRPVSDLCSELPAVFTDRLSVARTIRALPYARIVDVGCGRDGAPGTTR